MTAHDPASAVAAMFRAATGAAPWEEALVPLTTAVGAEHYSLLLRSTRRIVVVDILANSIPEEILAEYHAHYGALDPLAPRGAVAPRDRVFTSDDLMPFDRLRRTAFYNEWMGRHGMRRFLAAACDLPDAASFGAIAFQRPPGSDAFGDDERAHMNGLLPHLRSAMETWSRFAAASDRARDLESLLDAVGVGVALLGEDGRVRHVNAPFRAVLERGDGVSLRDGRLRMGSPARGEPMAAAIRRALQHGLPTTSTVDRPGGRGPYRLHVVPVSAASWKGLADDRVVVVRLHDPDQRNRALVESLRQLHGMTPAEAELTVHLARGASLAEIAAKTSRSIGTARNLLKRAFAKTDTHRQAELVCLVQRIENETGA